MNTRLKMSLAIAAIIIVVGGAAFALMSKPSPAGKETTVSASGEEDHGGEHDEHEEGGAVEMTAAERTAKGVRVAPVEARLLSDEVVVPGEVMLDLYRSVQIAPRISAQIVARHAKLGDKVEADERLVTLSSVEMADAQGALIVAAREWNRVQELGRDVVSERRYVEAQVAAEQARAKVLAFGMIPEQIDLLIKDGDASRATGTFDLLAPQDGTVVKDDFVLGEVAEPGRVLFQITDESRVWVEAQLTSDQAAHAQIGASVRVLIGKNHDVSGRIVQTHHTLDETTRTLPIRVVVDNAGDELHPGEYVSVAVLVGNGKKVIAVPESAVTLMEGKTTVFKAEGDEFHPTPIETGETRGGWIEVRSGLDGGDEIATTEVFLLKSLIQKSQMGEGHGH